MAEAPKLVDKQILKTLVPPSALNAENFQELARKAVVEDLPGGRMIFKKGDVDRKTIYLLSGEIELLSDDGKTTVVRGGTEEARHPLANQQPRQLTGRSRGTMQELKRQLGGENFASEYDDLCNQLRAIVDEC